nr:coniferyl alcohol acyltransferase [Schisandra chinensis]
MGIAGGEFSVIVSNKEVVAAILPLQEHWLPLSNLDLLLPPVDVSAFFFYKRPSKQSNMSFASIVSVLKKSISQALVAYYAFGGEIIGNSIGEPELLCNNRGVDFVEAYADVDLREVEMYNPDASVEGKLVPKKKEGVLCVQVTELKCGGVVVACTFDHRIADAYSANMFLVSWAEVARSKSLSVLPSFRRSPLNPRRPGSYDKSLDDMYVPISSLPPPPANPEPAGDHLSSRIYYVTAENLSWIQDEATRSGDSKRSKLQAFTAYLWKMIANSTDDDKKCTMGIVVDGRTRLNDESMANYFGNVLSIPYGEASVKELRNNTLDSVADLVSKYLVEATNKEHFLGLIDWVEAHRPEPAVAKVYAKSSADGPSVVVSSGQRFPANKVDFGWGKPVFGSYHFPWGGEAGYVMPMPSPLENGDWVVYMHLFKRHLDLVEEEAGDVFRRLSVDYLKLDQD